MAVVIVGNRRTFAVAAWIAAAAAVAPAAAAQGDVPPRPSGQIAAYPAHVVVLVVPFAAGGPTDAMARALAAALGESLQARFVVETIGGGGGTRGAERVARVRPNGYTLLLHHAGHAAAPFVHARLAYDPAKDFAPIGEVAEVPMVLLGRPGLPHDFGELAKWLRSQGAGARLGHAGPASASYLCGARFAAALGTQPAAVEYKGTARALEDLEKGRVDVLCDQTLNAADAVRAGRVRGYLIAGETRVDGLPGVPSAREAGVADLRASIWYGLFAPAATPPNVLAKLTTGLQSALASPALRDAMKPLGVKLAAPAAATPEALRARVEADMQRWRKAPPVFGSPQR